MKTFLNIRGSIASKAVRLFLCAGFFALLLNITTPEVHENLHHAASENKWDHFDHFHATHDHDDHDQNSKRSDDCHGCQIVAHFNSEPAIPAFQLANISALKEKRTLFFVPLILATNVFSDSSPAPPVRL